MQHNKVSHNRALRWSAIVFLAILRFVAIDFTMLNNLFSILFILAFSILLVTLPLLIAKKYCTLETAMDKATFIIFFPFLAAYLNCFPFIHFIAYAARGV